MSHDRSASIVGDAVKFTMHGPEQTLQVTIASSALQQYFGASPDPQTWLAAYIANFRVIHAVAQLSSKASASQLSLGPVDFSEEHIAELRASDAP